MTDALPDIDTMDFDDALRELEGIIEQIDAGDIKLEQAMEAHRRGRSLVLRCRAVLDAAEQELETSWQDDGESADTKAGD